MVNPDHDFTDDVQRRLSENSVVRCRHASGQRVLDRQHTRIDFATRNLSRDLTILPAGYGLGGQPEQALNSLLTEGPELTLEGDTSHLALSFRAKKESAHGSLKVQTLASLEMTGT